MNSQIIDAEKAIREIDARGRELREQTRKVYEEAFKGGKEEGKPPPDFEPSSFLLIKSYGGDIGARPMPANIPFWISPAIKVRPVGGGDPNTISAGSPYEIECEIHNRGDMPVPSANVEYFLTDPTIGFDTRYATPLGISSTWVSGLGVARTRIPFLPSSSQAGHKCLIVRAFSFLPYDIPVDDTNLSPLVDRHVAQLNINIVAQAAPFSFNIVRQPNFEGRLSFRAATLREITTAGLPLLAENEFIDGEKFAATLARTATFERTGGETELTLKPGDGGVSLFGSGKGPDLGQQKEMTGRLADALNLIASGKAHRRQFRELFRERRRMGAFATCDTLVFKTAEFGLKPGMMTAAHLSLTSALGETVGGVTLVLRG